MSRMEELNKLVALLEKGLLTKEEFEKRKSRLLRRTSGSAKKKTRPTKSSNNTTSKTKKSTSPRKKRPVGKSKPDGRKGTPRPVRRKKSSETSAPKPPPPSSQNPVKTPAEKIAQKTSSPKNTAKAAASKKVNRTPTKRPIGTYRRIKLLGKGPLARVFQARHIKNSNTKDNDVLLKLLHAQQMKDNDVLSWFKKVMKIKLDAPNVILPIELIEDVNHTALVMPFFSGVPLSKNMGSKVGPLSIEKIAKLFPVLLGLVESIHSNSKVHLNLKPSNFILSHDGTMKVMDFGFGLGSTNRRKQMMKMGPIDYKSPEVLTDDVSVDSRADIYSLGLILYEMLAGRLPFDKTDSVFALLQQKEKGRVHLPSFFNPSIPIALEKVVSRATRVDPNHRFATIQEFRSAFLKALEEKDEMEEPQKLIKVEQETAEEKATKSRTRMVVFWVLLICGIAGGWFLIQKFGSNELPQTITGSGYTAKLVPSGTFQMGCPANSTKECADDSRPHEVTITYNFYMMQSEISQALYTRVLNKSPSEFLICAGCEKDCDDVCPVEQISWYDALYFANALSELEGREPCYTISKTKIPKAKVDPSTDKKETSKEKAEYKIDVRWDKGTSCTGWRLPTEAEWEFAARGGEDFLYAGSNNSDEVAWVGASLEDPSSVVCQYKQNGYGLCDMTGNMFEWVWDKYSFYAADAQQDPIVNNGDPKNRMLRSGGFGVEEMDFPVYWREKAEPSLTSSNIGFRLCRTALSPTEENSRR